MHTRRMCSTAPVPPESVRSITHKSSTTPYRTCTCTRAVPTTPRERKRCRLLRTPCWASTQVMKRYRLQHQRNLDSLSPEMYFCVASSLVILNMIRATVAKSLLNSDSSLHTCKPGRRIAGLRDAVQEAGDPESAIGKGAVSGLSLTDFY